MSKKQFISLAAIINEFIVAFKKSPFLSIGLKLFLVVTIFSFIWASKKVEVVTFSQLQKQAEIQKNDTLYVINFWATWCAPCVQEMPFFEGASKQFSSEKVKMIYVSLNSVKEVAKVEHFIETKNIQNRVLLLNAPNPNDWINKIDSSWSGAIPATVMYKNGKKIFFKEGSFTQEEINSTITIKK